MNALLIPSAQADPVEHADWVELEAMQSEDGASSLNTLAAQIRISGTTDALPTELDEDPHDPGGEQSYLVAVEAWSEIERRLHACGGEDGAYPFHVTQSSIILNEDWQRSPYIFQALLARFGYRAVSNPRGDRLFEELSSVAAWQYFGGEANAARSLRFGFPREDRTNFPKALQNLCSELNAGEVRLDDPKIHDQKDSHLDVVAWRPFPDGRESQLIGFGQCATGKDWDETKLAELEPREFREAWLQSGFNPAPVKMFFVPRSIEAKEWRLAAIRGGIVFDRCRISHLIGSPSVKLQRKCSRWIKQAIQRLGSDDNA